MFARMIILSSDMRSVYKNIDKHWPWMLPSSHVKPGNTRLIFERLKLRAPFLFHSIGKFPGLNSQDIQLDFILLEMIVWSVTLVPKTCLWMNVLKGNGIQSIVSGYFVIVMVWEHLTRTRAHSYCGTIQKRNPWLLSSGAFAPINISQLFHWSKPIKASNLRHPMCVCTVIEPCALKRGRRPEKLLLIQSPRIDLCFISESVLRRSKETKSYQVDGWEVKGF